VKKSKFMLTSIGCVPSGTSNGKGSGSGGVTLLGESSSLFVGFVLLLINGAFSIERELSERSSYAFTLVPNSEYAKTKNL